jgi:phosphoglycerate dehydrogenase-like enzyme
MDLYANTMSLSDSLVAPAQSLATDPGLICINMGRLGWNRIFSPQHKALLLSQYGIDPEPDTAPPASGAILVGPSSAEIMLTSWGAEPIGPAMLEQFPSLKLVIHGAGSIKGLVTPAAVARGVRFCSGVRVNAQPVAEFCLGIILCHLKQVFSWRQRFTSGADLNEVWWGSHRNFAGGYYRKRVGLVGWGEIARCLASLLLHFDLQVFVCSTHLTEAEMRQYRVEPASLDSIMANCEVISLHSADIPANRHQINHATLSLMQAGSCLINTARGGLVDEAALVDRLRSGDIHAYLDVAQHEPPPRNHPFYSLPNCILTPHVSGSIGSETHRLGDYCLRELARFCDGLPPEYEMDLEHLAVRA